MKSFIVSPHDLAWMADLCPRCYWMKSRHYRRIGEAMPMIFQHIDKGMKVALDEETLRGLGVPCKNVLDQRKVFSRPFEFPELGVQLSISGFPDTLIETDDGECGVLEYKTCLPHPENERKYSKQVHAYIHAIERPADERPMQVSYAAIIAFDAGAGDFTVKAPHAAIRGRLHVMEVDISRTSFQEGLAPIAEMLSLDVWPDPSPDCQHCAYLRDVRRLSDAMERKAAAA